MIYLDYNATTPVDKEVADSMFPFINEYFGNPSSNHEFGIITKKALQNAREQVASLIDATPSEIIFTSGGSESNNMVIKGVAYSYSEKGNHIITSQTEHPAVLNPCKFLEKQGYNITYLPVDNYGIISLTDLKNAITPETILVSVMHSNNETGTLQPIFDIAKICKENNILFHSDASQSIGKIPVSVTSLGIDFLTIAGHKLYAPKGVGAVFIKNGINIEPLIHGASQENNQRAGTENIIYDIGLGKACELAKENLKSDKILKLTEYFFNELKNIFGNKIRLNGHPVNKLPNTLYISFMDFSFSEVSKALKDIAVSGGSACHSGSVKLSPVLKAMGIKDDEVSTAIRFSLGKYTTKTEIDFVIDSLKYLIK